MNPTLPELFNAHSQLDIQSIENPENYVLANDHIMLPAWWGQKGNHLFMPKSLVNNKIPAINIHLGLPPPENCCLILNGLADFSIMLWGRGSLLYVARSAKLNGAHIALGDGYIYIGEKTRATARLNLNCRNGGKIHFKSDILIASDVVFMTDDCHTVLSVKTRRRINPFGGQIEIGNHVWIGQKAFIMGGTSIGDDNIIGAHSLVRGVTTKKNVILAGSPARVIQTGVTWDSRDLPPEYIF